MVWSGCAGTVKQKREAGTNASLQICSQQSLQDRADHNDFIIEEFRKTVKAKLEERNISSFSNFVQIIVAFADLCYNAVGYGLCAARYRAVAASTAANLAHLTVMVVIEIAFFNFLV